MPMKTPHIVHGGARLGLTTGSIAVDSRTPPPNHRPEVVPWMPLVQSGKYLTIPATMVSTTVTKPRDDKVVVSDGNVVPRVPSESIVDTASIEHAWIQKPSQGDRRSVLSDDTIIGARKMPHPLQRAAEIQPHARAAPLPHEDTPMQMAQMQQPRHSVPLKTSANFVEAAVETPSKIHAAVEQSSVSRATAALIPAPVVPVEWSPHQEVDVPNTHEDAAVVTSAVYTGHAHVNQARTANIDTVSAREREPGFVSFASHSRPEKPSHSLKPFGSMMLVNPFEDNDTDRNDVTMQDEISNMKLSEEEEFGWVTSSMAEEEKRAEAAPLPKQPNMQMWGTRESTLQQKTQVEFEKPFVVGWGDEWRQN